jgi:hypothetical protein
MVKLLDIAGQRFGRLTVISEAPRRGRYRIWLCRCDCGSEKPVWQSALRAGITRSCGCLYREVIGTQNFKHGGKHDPEYSIWQGMKARCENPLAEYYHLYGGRGISICPTWRNDYARFRSDMGPKPSKRHSIERNDVDQNYTADNCRWATPHEQSRNMRSNRWLHLPDGRVLCLTDAATEFGIQESKLRYRLKHGWPLERALVNDGGRP